MHDRDNSLSLFLDLLLLVIFTFYFVVSARCLSFTAVIHAAYNCPVHAHLLPASTSRKYSEDHLVQDTYKVSVDYNCRTFRQIKNL